MSSDVRKIIYATLILFVLTIGIWISFLFVVGCQGTVGCMRGYATPARTSVATLAAATMPAPVSPTLGIGEPNESTQDVALPSVAGGPGPAVDLTGDPKAGETNFQQLCEPCHGPQGKGGVSNPGTDDGTVPPLNPIDDTMVSSDYKTFATNIDRFIEHGSRPEGATAAKIMPAWGDRNILTPQQIADIIAYIISLNQ
jgi:mono/diheme cytochrome c family protein